MFHIPTIYLVQMYNHHISTIVLKKKKHSIDVLYCVVFRYFRYIYHKSYLRFMTVKG